MDLEAAGGAISAGVIAGAIEKPTGHAGQPHGVCADCGAEVTGRFCSNCGQAAHVHRTLLHLGEELLHGVMHFDGRLWRTLPLLIVNPGRLTREWVQGRRTRYVSPLAMFLFTLFVMFFALSFMPHREVTLQSLPQQIEAQKEAIAEAEQVAAAARKEVDEAAAAMEPSDGSPPAFNSGARAGAAAGVLAGAEAGVMAASVGENGNTNGLTKTVAKKLKNPDLALYKLQQTIYKFAFLLVPLSIPFVALMFLWKRGFTLYDHGVFVLYSLTFMSLLLMAVVVAATTLKGAGAAVGAIAALIVPVHMFAQLKGAYSLSVFSTLWRTVVLLIFCEMAATLFIVSIIYLGLGH
ncbi:DUF3667 domain-containing protein [Brevundimonas naejangsanensis]|uniref:DUF3667 domain-containing protein n=1 Tax=Brevundimonas naejangsanensis TaxID=588932 RepID=UPI0026F11EE4|nr:DUF3667 domain-containing protein [Brevundimonas naejangsanensis]